MAAVSSRPVLLLPEDALRGALHPEAHRAFVRRPATSGTEPAPHPACLPALENRCSQVWNTTGIWSRTWVVSIAYYLSVECASEFQ